MIDWNDPTLQCRVLEQIHEAVIVVDREGVVRIWNPGAESLFGFGTAEMLGAGLEAIVPERLWHAHDVGFTRAVQSGTTKYAGRVMTTRAVHKDGSKRYVDLSFALLRDAVGTVIGVCAIGRDCTEREDAARAARSAPRQASEQ